jgi:phenylalanyl-tRNA synthetase beta chain
VHSNLLEKAGQDPTQAFQLSNALSPDLQYFRMSLMPSLLDRIHMNLKAGYDHFALFELGKAHNLLHADDDGLPTEFTTLGFVVTANDKAAVAKNGAAFYEARKYLDYLGSRFGFELEYTPLLSEPDFPLMKPYDYFRSAVVGIKGGEQLGVIGEFKPAVLRKFKLPKHTAGFEIDPYALLQSKGSGSRYRALPRFPKVEQDICLKVPAGTSFSAVEDEVRSYLDVNRPDNTYYTLSPLDIYQRDDDRTHKQLTFRLHIASFDRTLTDAEVSKLLDGIAQTAMEKFQAERI